MNQLTKTFEGHNVRILGTKDNPWFVLTDVCKVLDLSNPSEVAKRIREKYRSKNNLGRQGLAVTVNEAGLYQVIMRADQSPVAERFQDWVYEEVLPSIRKDGAYVAAQPDETPEEIMAKGLLAAQTTIERLKREREVAATKLEEQKPKVLFADAVSTSQTSILIGQLAKLITQNGHSIGQNRLFEWLRQHNYLGKTGQHRNEPTQYSMERGWFEVLERTNHNPDGSVRITRTTKVTGKGQIYFINKFLGN